MRKTSLAAALALAYPFATAAVAQSAPASAASASAPAEGTTKYGGVVTIVGSKPTSLPTEIPTTIHSSTAADIERTVNATDSEDALKYFPSLLVRTITTPNPSLPP